VVIVKRQTEPLQVALLLTGRPDLYTNTQQYRDRFDRL